MSRWSVVPLVALLIAVPVAARPAKTPAADLAGRTAGAPLECIGAFESDRGGEIYDSGDILYKGRGSRIYLNHPANCPGLRSDRRIAGHSPSSRQCRGDIFDIQDRVVPTSYGSCALGSFIPYDKPRIR